MGLGLCSQIDLDFEVARASKGAPVEAAEPTTTLLSAEDAMRAANKESAFLTRKEEAPTKNDGEKEIDADAVFAKLSSMKRTQPEDDDDDL